MDLPPPISRVEERKANRRFNIVVACVIGAFFAVFVGFGFYVVTVTRAAHSRFMTHCMQDHKKYECTLMWRASDSQPPAVVVIPNGR